LLYAPKKCRVGRYQVGGGYFVLCVEEVQGAIGT